MVSKLSKEGSFRKGLEVFQALPELGIPPDTAITNSAISACDKGARPAPRCHTSVKRKARQEGLTLNGCVERMGMMACRALPWSVVLLGADDTSMHTCICMHQNWSCWPVYESTSQTVHKCLLAHARIWHPHLL